jgi:wyosine [tRNA(Phe)-imidazoG37] synthetase (radical SAM superfamily)
MMKYDRFNLEEEIQNVWQTKDDLNAITERIYDDPDGPMTADELSNVLTGLSELHETRMKKLWKVFETMIHQKNSFLSEEHTMADVLDKIVDDAGKEDEYEN